MAVRDHARRALRAAGRTTLGQRVLAFSAREGLVPELGVVAAPEEPGHDASAPTAVVQDLWDRNLAALPAPTFAMVTDDLAADPSVPPLDRADVDVGALTPDQRHWQEHGYVLKRGLVPDELTDAYWERRMQLDRPHGWSCTAPYMHVPEVMALATYEPLNRLLDVLIGEPMGVSLNLTGVVSTERNWHQDDYLNPPEVKGWYAAAWFAVGDIDPDSGPFQFVPGSHRWPVLRRERVRLYLTPEERESGQWPRHTERFLDDLLAKEIAERGAPVETFIGQKGDVLIWHARLLHRGTTPRVPGTVRRSFIAHYTGQRHWGGGPMVTAASGGRYFVQDVPLGE